MRWGGLKESITHVDANIWQLLDATQPNTLASLYFGRGRTLSEMELGKRLELMAEIHQEVKYVDACQLKKKSSDYRV